MLDRCRLAGQSDRRSRIAAYLCLHIGLNIQIDRKADGTTDWSIVDYREQILAEYWLRGRGKKVIVLTLEDGLYRKAEYMEGETVPYLTFSELRLKVEQILAIEEQLYITRIIPTSNSSKQYLLKYKFDPSK